jgi:hypothetical protein
LAERKKERKERKGKKYKPIMCHSCKYCRIALLARNSNLGRLSARTRNLGPSTPSSDFQIGSEMHGHWSLPGHLQPIFGIRFEIVNKTIPVLLDQTRDKQEYMMRAKKKRWFNGFNYIR